MKTKRAGSGKWVALSLILVAAVLLGSLAVVGLAANPALQKYDVKISSSRTHTAILSGSDLYLVGSNKSGQLPDFSESYTSKPEKLLTGVSDVAVAPGRTLVISGGKLTMYGQDPVTEEFLSQPRVIAESGISAVFAAETTVAYITTSGELYTFGKNSQGQLGKGDTKDSSSPVKIAEKVKDVAVGTSFLLYLTEEGELFGCGANTTNQLGKDIGDVAALSPISLMKDVSMIAAGNAHTLAVKTNGELYTCGANDLNQTGVASEDDFLLFTKVLDDVYDIAAGDNHNLAIKNDGSVYAWGHGADGQLGDGTKGNLSTPTVITYSFASVFAYENSSFAVNSDGSICSFGDNTNYILGTGNGSSLPTPSTIFDKNMTWMPVSEENSGSEGGSGAVGGGESELPLPEKTLDSFMDGAEGGIMNPDKNITRAEYVKMVVVGLGLFKDSDLKTAPSFSDVPANKWFAPYIACAERNGLIGGYGDGSFKPNNNISRAEASKILAVALGLDTEAVPSKTFSDVSGWAKPFVDTLASVGIIGGYGDGSFKPDKNITRGETAKMIVIGINYLYTDEDLTNFKANFANPFPDVPTDKWYYPFILRAAGYDIKSVPAA